MTFPTGAQLAEGEEVFVAHSGWLRFPKNDHVCALLREGSFDYREQAFLWRLLRDGDTFIDGGAHAGLYSLLALAAGAPGSRVIAVEPNPELLPYLEGNLGPAIASGRAQVEAAALAATAGLARLLVQPGTHSAFSSLAAGSENATVEVRTTTLDDLCPESGAAVVKLDLEGAECLALAGATACANRVAAMLVECTELNLRRFGNTTSTLVNALRDLGFTLAKWNDADDIQPYEPVPPVWYENLLAVRDLEFVRGRLRGTSESSARVAKDILARGRAIREVNSGALRLQVDASRSAAAVARNAEQDSLRRLSEAEVKLDNAYEQLDEAYRRVGEANWMAEQARMRSDHAQAELAAARDSLHDAVLRADAARAEANAASGRAEAAESDAVAANARAEAASAEARQYKAAADEASSTVESLRTELAAVRSQLELANRSLLRRLIGRREGRT